MIHVMAATGLGGAAMAAPVVGYDAIAVLQEEQHLRVPVIGRQRPAMAEDDGLSAAPVLIIDLDAAGIFLADSNVWHWCSPYSEKFEISPVFNDCFAVLRRQQLVCRARAFVPPCPCKPRTPEQTAAPHPRRYGDSLRPTDLQSGLTVHDSARR